MTLHLIILLLSLVLLLCAAANVPDPPRANLGWAGMFFYVLSQIPGIF